MKRAPFLSSFSYYNVATTMRMQHVRSFTKNIMYYNLIPPPFLFAFCFLGQQTNSTPEKTSIPHGSSIAKLLTRMPRPPQASAAVAFHLSKSRQRDWLWMWSNRQCSGTSSASDWKGPASLIGKLCYVIC